MEKHSVGEMSIHEWLVWEETKGAGGSTGVIESLFMTVVLVTGLHQLPTLMQLSLKWVIN